MSVDTGLLQLVKQDSAVNALVSGHVFQILAPKGNQGPAALPYIIQTCIATHDDYSMSGVVGLREGLFQYDCYDTTHNEARAIAKALRDLLKNYKGTLPDSDSTQVTAVFVDKDWDMPFEEGGKSFVHRVMMHFRVHYIQP